jgi:putative heme-binding domain-containing protein
MMRRSQLVMSTCFLGVMLGLTAPGSAQRDLTQIPDPDPEIERRSFQLPEGFEVNLFAADPLLAKPIQMNFDPDGRLWVACSETYPQIKPGQKANDKIIVLEDTNGDGRADKTSVFADGLLIPTGVEPGDGGAYVANSTELLHLADTNGDGKADTTRVMLSGFGTEDTHHIVHTFRWGPDGRLYFNQSIYIHSHIETPHGVRRLNAGGVWQFRPETMQLEVFLRGFCNPWGHHFDRWGQSFVTDGAYGEGINYGIRGAYYVFAQPAPRLLAGLNPGSPKHCGLEVVSGRHLPDDWQGSLITNDFRGHRVCRFVLKDDGAGFASQEMPEVIKTNHAAFRPIDVKMGPDGAIYIADWYNPIIQHGEVDFRDPRRDHTHGRIWRVTARGRPLVERPKLREARMGELLDALKAPEDWTRQQAKRVLKERGAAKVRPALLVWLSRLDPSDPDYEHQLLEALWVYQSLDIVEPHPLTMGLLKAKDPRARAAAARVIGDWQDRLPESLEMLSTLAADDHPRVRLEAVRALGRRPDFRALQAALKTLDRPMDNFLDYGLWLTVRDLEPVWLPELRSGRLAAQVPPRHLAYALRAAGTPEMVGPMVDLLQRGQVPLEARDGVLAFIAAQGDPGQLAQILELVMVRADLTGDRRAMLLAALEQAARRRGVRPGGDLTRLSTLFDVPDVNLQAASVRLAGLWRVESLRPQILRLGSETGTPAPIRHAAMEALAALGGDASRQALADLTGPHYDPEIRQAAVMALASLDLDAACQAAVKLLGDPTAHTNAAGVFAALLQQKNGPDRLTVALEGRELPADVAKVGLRAARATGRDHTALATALMKAGKLATANRTLTPAQMKQLVEDVQKLGDPARGELIYRRTDQACQKCHAIAGAGGLVGPDLASIGASAPVDYLIESLLLPNKAIKENYHSLIVATTIGKVLTGVKVRESATELVLRDAEDRELVIPTKDIEEKAVGGSLMPEGQTDTLTRQEFLDLVRFLSELGKVGPYAVSKARLARRWLTLAPTPQAYRLLTSTSYAAAANGDTGLTWTPAYSTVHGLLPLDALGRFEFTNYRTQTKDPVGFARCELEVTTPGEVELQIGPVAGLGIWLDGKPVTLAPTLRLELSSGRHTLTLMVDLSARREPIRLELSTGPSSAAQARFVDGK